jgi:hypothetical protein
LPKPIKLEFCCYLPSLMVNSVSGTAIIPATNAIKIGFKDILNVALIIFEKIDDSENSVSA